MNQMFENLFVSSEVESIVKLSIAAIIGIVIGLERELKKKPVGIKTLLVISVGSTLLTIISIASVGKYTAMFDNVVMDPLRLPAQIVSGIGFLGAGVIWKRNNDVVSGLTTAAIVWGVGGIGIAIGANFMLESFFAVVLFIIGVEIVPIIVQKISKYDVNQKIILLKLSMNKEQSTKEIMSAVKSLNINIRNVRVKDEKEGGKTLEIRGYINQKIFATDIYENLSQLKEVKKIEINE